MKNHEKLNIEILQATVDQKPILRNLMQYYKYDTSEYTLADPNPFGQFDYNYLDHYWTEHGMKSEGRTAYLVKVNGQLAGFALVNNFDLGLKCRDDARNIAEFFIMRKWRRLGVGKAAAFTLFNCFQGQWEVKQERENQIAQRFWEAAIREYTNGNYVKLDSHLPEWDGPVIRFHSRDAVARTT